MYQADAPLLHKKVYFSKNTVSLFVTFSKTKGFENFKEVKAKYDFSLCLATPNSTQHIIRLSPLPNLSIIEKETSKELILQFVMPTGNPDAGIFLKLTDITKDVTQILDLGLVFSDNMEKHFLMKDIDASPIATSYFYTNTPFKITTSTGIDSLQFTWFAQDFPAATPPYIINPPPFDMSTLQADSSGAIYIDSLTHFNKVGLAVFSAQSKVSGSFAVLFQSQRFPTLTTAKELIEPLVYIASKEEYAQLLAADDKKEALDAFWLSIGGNITYSKKLIQLFYSRVELANKLFTTYKAGWKTDRGMIFMVFGKPDAVNSGGNKTNWYYHDLNDKEFYNFTFQKTLTAFSQESYELVRKEAFSTIWRAAVEKLRKGIILK